MRPKPNLYILSSVAGGGKSTIISQLLQEFPDFYFSISCTTRKPRPGDIPGKTYYFLDIPQFETKIQNNEFYEWAMVHGNYYGTPKEPILKAIADHRVALLDLDVQGAKSVKSLRPESVTIFIKPPTTDIWIERLIRRGTETEESIERRIQNGMKELEEIPFFDHVVINDELPNAIEQVKQLLFI